jgi:hypothetical protein
MQIDFLAGCRDDRFWFFLKRVDHPDILANPKRVDHAKCLAAVARSEFHHAATKTSERLGNRRMFAFGSSRQGIEQIVARARGTSSKSCPAAFTQLDRARVLRHCDDGGKLVITCQAPGAITGDHGPVARALPVGRYRAAGMACVSSLCWRL